MATLPTYKTLVQSEIDDTSTKVGTVIVQALKDTYQEILLHVSKYLINSTEEDVVASTSNRYVTPVNTYSEFTHVLWHSATDTNFKELKPMKEEDYYSHYVNSDPGEPTRYYLKGNKVYFDLIPSSAGTVKVVGFEVQDELDTAGSVTSVIPDRFTRVLLLGTIARVKAYERLPEANEYLRMFKGSFWAQGRIDGALGEMIRELSVKRRVVKPTFFGR